MSSIRATLLGRIVGGSALVLAGAGGVLYLAVASSLEAQFDRNLADRVEGFASILFQVEDEVSFEFSDELMPEYERAEAPAYFELWHRDGRLLERSRSLAGSDLELPADVGREAVHWSAPLPDGRPGRYVAKEIEVHHVYPEEGPGRPDAAEVVVAVARGREGLVRAERAVLLQCLAATAVLIGLVGFLSYRSVERGLAPARRLAAALDAIRAEDLPERLEPGAVPDELAPVVRTTDALLGRVRAALERERRTAADVAHELRTPISELVTVTEVALRNGLLLEEARRTLGTVHAVAWRMGRSVSTLLELARIERGAGTFASGPVDLGRVLDQVLGPLRGPARARALALETDVPAGTVVETDEGVVRIVLANLLGNAVQEAPAGSRVRARLERGAGLWRLVVENEAPQLEPADLAALREPFWRKDRARTDRDHAGLGLALSSALAERAGLELAFELEGTRFRALLAGEAAPTTP